MNKHTQRLSGNGWTAVVKDDLLEISIVVGHRKLVGALKRSLKHFRYSYEITPRGTGPAVIDVELRQDDQWTELCSKLMGAAEAKLAVYLARKAKTERNRGERQRERRELRTNTRRIQPSVSRAA